MFNFNIGTPQERALWTEAFRQFAPGVSSNPLSNHPLYNGPTTVHRQDGWTYSDYKGQASDEFIFTSSTSPLAPGAFLSTSGGDGNDLMIDTTEKLGPHSGSERGLTQKTVRGGLGNDHMVSYLKNNLGPGNTQVGYDMIGDEGNDTMELIGGGHTVGDVFGGSGDDNITVRSAVPVDPASQENLPTQSFWIEGNEGNDTINLEGLHQTNVTINSFGSAEDSIDTYNVKLNTTDKNAGVQIYGGNGQDTVNLDGGGWVQQNATPDEQGMITFKRNPVKGPDGKILRWEQSVSVTAYNVETVNVAGKTIHLNEQPAANGRQTAIPPAPTSDGQLTPVANGAPREANAQAA